MWTKIGLWSWIFLLFAYTSEQQGKYSKTYYENGMLQSEGWLLNGANTGYWKFYHPNGTVAEQGHFQNNQREKYWYFYDQQELPLREGHYHNGKMMNWWLFYDDKGKINHKCQLREGIKNGYCLKYRDQKLTSAEKYKNGRKIKEWHDFNSFKRENSLSDLH